MRKIVLLVVALAVPFTACAGTHLSPKDYQKCSAGAERLYPQLGRFEKKYAEYRGLFDEALRTTCEETHARPPHVGPSRPTINLKGLLKLQYAYVPGCSERALQAHGSSLFNKMEAIESWSSAGSSAAWVTHFLVQGVCMAAVNYRLDDKHIKYVPDGINM